MRKQLQVAKRAAKDDEESVTAAMKLVSDELRTLRKDAYQRQSVRVTAFLQSCSARKLQSPAMVPMHACLVVMQRCHALL